MNPHRPFRLRCPLWRALAVVSLACSAIRAADLEAEASSLRAAIRDLSATFGTEYPAGEAFLKRLDTLPPGDATALDSLRREALLANPLLRRQPILFVSRRQFAPDHHNTETFFQTGEINTGSYRGGGSLKCFDPATGQSRMLLDAGPDGLARDPEVSPDGRRIVFSLRKDRSSASHIFEIHADGTGLRQLTSCKDANDIDPVYLPGGSIVFTSTRDPKYCMCNRHIMGNLFRMDGNGANILQIGKSTLFEGHTTVLPDGRLLYDRWEYVDRNFGDAQALWTVNPDGTNHSIYWGSNLSSPGGVIDARALPGSTSNCLAVFAACHDRPWGAIALIDRNQGVDSRASVLRTWPADAINLVGKGGFDSNKGMQVKYEDPFPLSDRYFLASRMVEPGSERMAIVLLDLFGNEVVVHFEEPGCFDPMPLTPRPAAPVIPARRKFDESPGRFYAMDVRVGTHMAGIQPGEIKFLRVVESPEKRSFTSLQWGGQGAQAPAMNWHNFENKRILGTVPVEEDGSAYFEVPSNRYVFFQLLDRDKRMLHSMRSGTIIQPGEMQSCVGCHENRSTSAPTPRETLALRKGPRALEPWYGPPREFSYLTEVQPVFDRHCVSCHDFGKEATARLNLAGDRETVFNASYTELWSKKWIECVGAGPADIQAAKSWGSHASRLPAYLRPDHYQVHLTTEEIERVETWIDLNAPYYPKYESGLPDGIAGRCPLTIAESARLRELTGIDLTADANFNHHRIWISFDRPELSPILTHVPEPAKREETLALICAGQQRLKTTPRGDTADFKRPPADQARYERASRLARRDAAFQKALREGRKVHDSELSDP